MAINVAFSSQNQLVHRRAYRCITPIFLTIDNPTILALPFNLPTFKHSDGFAVGEFGDEWRHTQLRAVKDNCGARWRGRYVEQKLLRLLFESFETLVFLPLNYPQRLAADVRAAHSGRRQAKNT